jgi:nucleoside-diphosphate-sugar epimerase
MMSNTMLAGLKRKRILILGASGWLGRTLIRELLAQGSSDHYLISSRPRQLTVGSQKVQVHAFSLPEVRNFRPEVVVNCAFLTKDKFQLHDLDTFIKINANLTAQFFQVLSLKRVELGLTISSGSATLPTAESIELNPYGYLKKLEQDQLLLMRSPTLIVGVARAWSLSGDLVPNPTSYAFSDFIWQALTAGKILVEAPSAVWRRYCDAAQFLNVSLATIMAGGHTIVDSGGSLVEMRHLASTVSSVLGNVPVECAAPSGDPEIYASDGNQYRELCKQLEVPFEPIDLQIERVTENLRKRIHSGKSF